MLRNKVTAIVITKNEEAQIDECLSSLSWCNEIVVVDTGSNDKTIQIAKKHTGVVVGTEGGSYSDWRNLGLLKAKNEWIFYLDSDERCSDSLRNEILNTTSSKTVFSYFAIPRSNIILGKEMKHGGWWPDYVKRLYKKRNIKGWVGELHEEPRVEGKMGFLTNPITHIKHDNFKDMLEKTNTWSAVEAKLMFDANHPPMNPLRFTSAITREIWKRMVLEKGFLDGPEGILYSIYQMYSKFISYAKLWELQNTQKIL